MCPAWLVRSFVEKSSPAVAARCLRDGWLWNTQILVSRLGALLEGARAQLPRAAGLLEQASAIRSGSRAAAALRDIYDAMPSADLSRDLLERIPGSLAVAPLPSVVWSDLGTPARVQEALQSAGLARPWVGEDVGAGTGLPRSHGDAPATPPA